MALGQSPSAAASSATRPRAPRPIAQFSVQGLMIFIGLLACGLAAWRMAGMKLLLQYAALLYVTGPWCAYLIGECLPLRQRTVRIALANALLMGAFALALKLVEGWYGWPAAFYLTAGTLLVWTPQYVAFFWRRVSGI